MNPDEPQADRVLHISGYDVYLHANTYFRIGHDEVVKAIAPIAESAGWSSSSAARPSSSLPTSPAA